MWVNMALAIAAAQSASAYAVLIISSFAVPVFALLALIASAARKDYRLVALVAGIVPFKARINVSDP